MENRTQFTFYESFFKAVNRIRKKADRADAYDAIVAYALYGIEPDVDSLPDAVAITFELVKPNLISSRRKAEGGKRRNKKEDDAKIAERCAEDTAKISERCAEDIANKKKIENEIEIKKENELEIELENECYISPPEGVPPTGKKPISHKHGRYGWVKLTDEEYGRLAKELGVAELERCITYVDESAQSTGNKNKWRDWNLVIRKCSRDKWGLSSKAAASKAMVQQSIEGPTEEEFNELLRVAKIVGVNTEKYTYDALDR